MRTRLHCRILVYAMAVSLLPQALMLDLHQNETVAAAPPAASTGMAELVSTVQPAPSSTAIHRKLK
jgi:hypothetical protein